MTFAKPSFTVDAVVLAGAPDTHILLVERGKPPFRGHWALPGGFVEPYELPHQACVRELREETSLVLSREGFPLRLRARKGRDPRGWTLSQPFLYYMDRPIEVCAGDDAARAQWLPLSQLDRLAFDHGAILCEALGLFWQDMPSAHPALARLPVFGVPTSSAQRLTFYGGSFNPLHEGHLACAVGFPFSDELVVVPDTNPFKAGPADRCYWQLYRQLCQRFGPHVRGVFPGFCGREQPNPTASWLPHVRAESKGLLMGEDSMVDFPKWRDSKQLARALDHLFVVPRQASRSHLFPSMAWMTEVNPACTLVHLAHHPWRHLASSALRQSN